MIQIGPYTLDNRLALAPMAGVTDQPFRVLCKQLGAGYVVGEMLSSDPSLRHSRKSTLRRNHAGEAAPVSVQIAGADPQRMAEAAQFNIDCGAQIIDINMGCPAKKVCNRMAGSALLEHEALVQDILETVCAAVDVPVTLKIRTGPDEQRRNGVRIARIAENAGIAALAVHGRTRSQRFKGAAEFETIREICQTVEIPVFANGDINQVQDARTILDHTQAAGLMIGRGAQGNPWIFREILHYLAHGQALPAPTAEEVHQVLSAHLRALHRFYGAQQGVRVARKHIGWYLQDRPGGRAARQRLMQVQNADQQLTIIDQYFQQQDDLAA